MLPYLAKHRDFFCWDCCEFKRQVLYQLWGKQTINTENKTAGIYLLKVNDRITRTRSEICSELTIET